MSGGTFDYKQHYITDIAETIIAKCNESKQTSSLSKETIKSLLNGVKILEQAAIYAQRADWLFAGDDGENSYHKRLNEELAAINTNDILNQIDEILNTPPEPEIQLSKFIDKETGLIHISLYDDCYYQTLCNTIEHYKPYNYDKTEDIPTCQACLKEVKSIKDNWK